MKMKNRMGRRTFVILVFLPVVFASACARQGKGPLPAATSTGVDQKELSIFAAASLAEAFGEIGKSFETAHPGVKVIFNFAGSQQLAQQINSGAPADIFASANQKEIDIVISDGRISKGTDRPFAKNRLVVVIPKDNPAGISSIEELAKSGLRLVLAAKEVPAGQYTQELLEKTTQDPALGPAFRERVLGNVVSYEDNVKAVLSKVALGEADAGIVYRSDIFGGNSDRIIQVEIPGNLNILAAYPIAPLQDSQHLELAQGFIDFVLSTEGQVILENYGLIPIKK